MASQLESAIRQSIAKGFKGRLLTGTLLRGQSITVDEYGDEVELQQLTFAVEGFVDNYSDAYRATAGIPETDVRITLILGNCETEPRKDDVVFFPTFGEYKLRGPIKIDPARASAECQAFLV